MPTKMIGNYKEVFMKIYADNAATTKMSRHAIDAMIPYMEEIYGNPSSLYAFAQKATEAVAEARATVAASQGSLRECKGTRCQGA